MRLLLALLPVLLVACGGTTESVRQPTDEERASIVKGVDMNWDYEARIASTPAERRRVDRAGLHPRVAQIRISRADPRHASAIVEIRDRKGRTMPRTAIVLLRKESDPEVAKFDGPWSPEEGPSFDFREFCNESTADATKELVCPDPWKILGYARPPGTKPSAYEIDVNTSSVENIDWQSITLPAGACGSPRPFRLRGGAGTVRASQLDWWGAIGVDANQPSWNDGEYGDLDNDRVTNEAALGLVCSNGGGTASGQIAFQSVIFQVRAKKLRVLGIIRAQQPRARKAMHTPIIGNVEITAGKVIAREYWYGPDDGTCCPTGRATSIWTFSKGRLRLTHTVIDLPPAKPDLRRDSNGDGMVGLCEANPGAC